MFGRKKGQREPVPPHPRQEPRIDGPLTAENLPRADLILIAIRPGAAVAWVAEHAALIAPSAILVDLCGVKRTVVAAIAPIAEQHGFAYIGGRPSMLPVSGSGAV